MPLPIPRLDDRDFATLMRDALDVARKTNPGWSDGSAGDPGMTLLELFAFLTDNLLYRVNRVPDRLYITLLNLMGISMRPPAAAVVSLVFSRPEAGDTSRDIAIAPGVRVASADGTVEFSVGSGGVLEAGRSSIELKALHCERIEAELVGTGTGAPGQVVHLRHGPVIANDGEDVDVVMVAVECAPAEAERDGGGSVVHDGRTFHVWTRVANFGAAADGQARVYMLDRSDGRISFGGHGRGMDRPTEVPASGREIRAWYHRGGGRTGNVVAGTLTTLRTPGLELVVDNPGPAAGGADGETLDEVLRRGPEALDATGCVATARDYERLARCVRGIARACAMSQAQRWRHAPPGSIEVLLVPGVEPPTGQPLDATTLAAGRNPLLLAEVEQLFEKHRPLGVRTVASWAQYREVTVSTRVVAAREAHRGELQARLQHSLQRLFSPYAERRFGQPVRRSDVYEALLAEPEVRYVETLGFALDEAPELGITALCRDPHQARTWFAGTADGLYGSRDGGDSWARLHGQTGAQVDGIACHPEQPGLMAYSSPQGDAHAIHLSRDCGRSWTAEPRVFKSRIHDMAWTSRNGRNVLLIATEEGLFEWQPGGSDGPVLVVVIADGSDSGFRAVATHTAPTGVVSVAVAARANGGIHLSTSGGVSGSYRPIGLKGKDIRSLGVQVVNARSYLWAGAGAEALQQGEGAFRCELRAGGEDDPEGFKAFNAGWQGGSCACIAFSGTGVHAGSNRGGVLTLDAAAASPTWRSGWLGAGLPIRDEDRLYQPILALDADPDVRMAPDGTDETDKETGALIAGTELGLFRSRNGGASYVRIGARESTEDAPLPPDWLYCSGNHVIHIVIDENGT